MKNISFLGASLDCIRAFPNNARTNAGYQLHKVQEGRDPSDWKPMTTIGPGVREIRIRDAAGAFRIIYVATLPDQVLVLHAFQKKTQATPQRELNAAARRLREWRTRHD